jgi:hypothetical protein
MLDLGAGAVATLALGAGRWERGGDGLARRGASQVGVGRRQKEHAEYEERGEGGPASPGHWLLPCFQSQ